VSEDPREPRRTGSAEERLAEEVGRKAQRKRRARRARGATAWFGLGMFGLVGWSVAVPTLLGISLGLWLDRRWPGAVSWTLTCLFIGVALGCLNVWYWVDQEQRRD
jgi:ATP synthase protein I